MAALVLDIGSWYRADRATQSTADAAALAGAQALPTDPRQPRAHSRSQYAAKNGGGSRNVTSLQVRSDQRHDQVTVNDAPRPGIFTKLFGVNSVTVGSHGDPRAESDGPSAKYVAPIGVNVHAPEAAGTGLSALARSGSAGRTSTTPAARQDGARQAPSTC